MLLELIGLGCAYNVAKSYNRRKEREREEEEEMERVRNEKINALLDSATKLLNKYNE